MSDGPTDSHINIVINQRAPLKLELMKPKAAYADLKGTAEAAEPRSGRNSMLEVPAKNFGTAGS